MSNNNILFIDHADGMGGAENILLLLMNHLNKQVWNPNLAVSNGRFLQLAQQNHIPAHTVVFPKLRRSPMAITNWGHGGRAIAKIAKTINARILHANTIRASLYTAVAAKHTRIPFIWHMHDFWLSENEPQQKWLDSRGKWMLSQMATVIIANSQATATHLPPSEKLVVVHNGIDLAEFDLAIDGRNFRQQHNIPHNQPVVGMMGRLRPWKGQTTFLNIAAQISQTHPQTRFLVVGGNPFTTQDAYAAELRQIAQDLQLTDKITFTGQITDVQSALTAMDIFVHPGAPEPFGLVNIEAMAMQRPVVAFAHGALPEIVVDGETGLLIPPNNINTMAAQITTLLDDKEIRMRMGENGRKRIETHFTIQQTVTKITEIYEQILNDE